MASRRALIAAAVVTAGGMAGGAWTYAAMSPGSQLFGRTLIAGNDPLEAALTFDDGPNGDTTLRLVDVLARHHARATFFSIGRYAREQPEVLRAVAAAGHAIGNHTMTHPWLHVERAARIESEIRGANALIEDAIGAPVRLFRPPHGARRPFVLQCARELGLTTVQWNVAASDWNPYPPEVLCRRVLRGVATQRRRGRGSNILLHDGGEAGLGQPRMATVSATDAVLRRLKLDGMRTVTVEAWI